MQNIQRLGKEETRKSGLNKRLEEIGWALFLVMIGCLLIVPSEQVPGGTWLIGTGLIMIGLNFVRYFNQIRMNIFTLALGVLALGAGLADFFGVELPLFAIFLILIGVSIILKPLIERKS